MKTYNEIKHTIEWEVYYDYDNSWTDYPPIDTAGTARAIWKYLKKDGTLDTIRTYKDEWRAEELIHLSVLDYLSSYEPKVKN